MDSIALSFSDSSNLRLFTPKYLKNDYYLIVNSTNDFHDSSKRLSTKTLTFFWDNKDNSILGIEAYTNIDRWQHGSFSVPAIDRSGTIHCINSFDNNNIAKSLNDLREDWAFNDELSLLRIAFIDIKATQRIQAGKNIVVGVNDSMGMSELWIENLKIE